MNKMGEYLRTIELFRQINNEQGLGMAFYFLHDIQYNGKDLKEMAYILVKEKSYTSPDKIDFGEHLSLVHKWANTAPKISF